MKDGTIAAALQDRLDALLAAADGPEGCAEDDFVASGLHAARHSRGASRQAILCDVARVLGCGPGDLAFLFAAPLGAANDSDPVHMPDYRQALRPVTPAAKAPLLAVAE